MYRSPTHTLVRAERAARPRAAALALALSLALAVAGLAGCGGDSEPTGPREPESEPAPAAAAPDLRFEPAALTLAPGDSAQTTVRVEPAADLRGATFTLDGAPPGLSTSFQAASDGASGTLTVAASADAGAVAESLLVKGSKADGSKTWVGWLTLSVSGTTTARTLFVDPATGSDANRGTQDRPFKTLTKGLSNARAGDTVKLAGGGYGPAAASGEQFPASGLVVPAGVTIEGALDSGFPVSTLVGTGTGVGLAFAGDATVRNLFVGGQGFGVGLYAKQGTQTLSNVFMGVPAGASAVVDGVTAGGGLVLRGTARATLLAGASGANTTGSTIIVNGVVGKGGIGVSVSDQAQFTMGGVAITLNSNSTNAVQVDRQAQFTMDGGKIEAAASLTCPSGSGVSLADAAQATLKNQVALTNLASAVGARDAAKATLLGTVINKAYGQGCSEFPSVNARGSASLSFDGATITATGGQATVGIQTRDSVILALKATTVANHTGKGIDLNANERLTVDFGNINRNGTGIEARPLNDGTGTKKMPFIKITNAALIANKIGIDVEAPILKLRNSSVRESEIGIEIRGVVGGIPIGDTCAFACVNLGFGTDLGNNNFVGNTGTAVLFRPNDINVGISVPAVGNIWNAKVQGANDSGLYTTRVTIRAGDPLANGKNFSLPFGTNTFIAL